MDKILKVKGFGEVAVRPEKICVFLTLISTNKNFKTALSEVEAQKHLLFESLIKAGLKEESATVSHYDVRQEYEYLQNVKKFKGYRVSEGVEIKFDFNTQKLSDLIEQISLRFTPSISVYFTADRENYEATLLEKAVEDAENRAKILAKASKTKLKGIKHIFYGVNDEATVSYEQTEGALMKSASFNDVSVDDIKFYDTVVVEWEIE